jgi:hypothetical protein
MAILLAVGRFQARFASYRSQTAGQFGFWKWKERFWHGYLGLARNGLSTILPDFFIIEEGWIFSQPFRMTTKLGHRGPSTALLSINSGSLQNRSGLAVAAGRMIQLETKLDLNS